MVDNGAVDLYLGRCGMICRCKTLLGTSWYAMGRQISTGDFMVGYVTEYLYWGRCGKKWADR